MQIQDALALYLRVLGENGLSQRTLYTYGMDAKQIGRFFGNCELNKLTKAWVGKFLKSKELIFTAGQKPRSPKTVMKTLYFFRRFLQWSLEQEFLTELPLPVQLQTQSIRLVVSNESLE